MTEKETFAVMSLFFEIRLEITCLLFALLCAVKFESYLELLLMFGVKIKGTFLEFIVMG